MQTHTRTHRGRAQAPLANHLHSGRRNVEAYREGEGGGILRRPANTRTGFSGRALPPRSYSQTERRCSPKCLRQHGIPGTRLEGSSDNAVLVRQKHQTRSSDQQLTKTLRTWHTDCRGQSTKREAREFCVRPKEKSPHDWLWQDSTAGGLARPRSVVIPRCRVCVLESGHQPGYEHR